MGQNEQEWTDLAAKCEKAGASVIECNFSCPNMEDDDLGVTIGQSPELVERFTRATKRGTSLPVLAKLTPNITDGPYRLPQSAEVLMAYLPSTRSIPSQESTSILLWLSRPYTESPS